MTSEESALPAKMETPVGFATHDHAQCVTDALETAESRCAEKGLNFTPVRRKVLELLLKEHRALGAYSILDLLREAGFKSQPPVAYRALDFLTEYGFVHKIARLNAFVACSHAGETHTPAFMICRVCETVAEARSAPLKGALGEAAQATGFRIEKTSVEAEGVCRNCAGAGQP